MTTFFVLCVGSTPITGFRNFVSVYNSKVESTFSLFSIICPLLTPYKWSCGFKFFSNWKPPFPECPERGVLGSLAMFSTSWRHSCASHASSNGISVSCFQCYHMKPQRVKLIYIDKSEQNWRQLKFLSVLCAQNNKIFAWKPIPNSMNIQSQYFCIELLFSCCFSCRQTV